MSICIRGHVLTIFGKINVIMTLREEGGLACDATFFVCVLLLFIKYLPRTRSVSGVK